jgi:hypothetical protein
VSVGQWPGACSLVQPNTGHCRGLSDSGAWLPFVAGDPPLASRAALAAFLATLLFLFPPGTVIIVLTDGSPPGGCATDAPEGPRATASCRLGDAGRTTPLVSGGPSGPVQSVAWLSSSLSDTTSGSA